MRFRLLAIDLDGTLLNSGSELSKANREALHRAHEAGLVICICTGRNLVEAQPVIEQIGLDLNAGVFVFGAVVADLASRSILHRNPLSASTADRLVRYFTGTGHHVLVLYERSEAGCDYLLVEGGRNGDAYEKWLAITPSRAERTAVWQPRPCAPLRVGIIEHPDRIEETMLRVRAAFAAHEAKINSIYAPNYRLHVVECFAPQVNKWYGLTQLADRLGIAPSQIVAVGDDVNDLEMIANAGLGVAMANAIPAVRSTARHQTASNDRDGVAVLIHHILDGTCDSADLLPGQFAPGGTQTDY